MNPGRRPSANDGGVPLGLTGLSPRRGSLLRTFVDMTAEQLETALRAGGMPCRPFRAGTGQQAAADGFAHPVTLEMGRLFERARGSAVLGAPSLLH